FGRGLVVHAVSETDAVLQNLLRLPFVPAQDCEAGEVLVAVVDVAVGERHGDENLVVAWIDDDVHTRVVGGKGRCFHVGHQVIDLIINYRVASRNHNVVTRRRSSSYDNKVVCGRLQTATAYGPLQLRAWLT